ncbi:MAG: hypothetical protein A2X12_07300 [Bacteroidetes bacterium GWE2_29_8]|nr:MAG: hypothetical protein A2X12_07300 [Bacteroidetes bacterium GWE2_29_8]OFY22583.1 MAG: hypothetical protein A2X02_02345 [Bacteroidetes bacterium GWF2_29_10]
MIKELLSKDKADFYYNDVLINLNGSIDDYKYIVMDFKNILNNIFKIITSNDNIVFTGLFARINYISTKYNIDNKLNVNINELRKFANRIEHNQIKTVNEKQFLTSLKVITDTIHYFSNIEIPFEIKRHFEEKDNLLFISDTQQDMFTKNIIDIARCIITDISEINTDNKGNQYFWINCIGINDSNNFKVKVQDSKDYKGNSNNLIQYNDILWKNSVVNLIRITQKQEESNKIYYATKYDSLIVIEPDYLIDVTDIAECFGKFETNYLFYFFNKLLIDSPNQYLYAGKIINSLLDKIITDDLNKEYIENNFDEILREIIEDDLLLTSLFTEHIPKIKNEIKQIHLANLINAVTNFKQNNSKINVEPAFFSNIYGILGRLDAMLVNEENDTIDIFELKSGKPPENIDIWPNNKVQVACYNLLLQSTYGAKRKGNSQILYSKATINPLRNVESYIELDNKIMSIRNNIVKSLFELSVKDFSVIENIKSLQFSSNYYQDFVVDKGKCLKNKYNNLSEIENIYYQHQLSFIIKEMQTAKTGAFENEYSANDKGFSAFWESSYLEKTKQYNIIYDMTFLGASEEYNGSFEFCFNQQINHNFREKDIAILYPFNEECGENLKSQIIKGNIIYISEQKLVFSPKNTTIFKNKNVFEYKWAIEHDLYETNFWSQIRLLSNFINANQHFKDLILSAKTPTSIVKNIEKHSNLNQNQYDMLCKAIEAKDYFLLQGPPGTGKTSKMLMHIVKQLMLSNCTNIVILAYTNRAVEEICINIEKHDMQYLKISGKEKSINNIIEHNNSDYTCFRNNITNNRIFVSTIASFNTRVTLLKKLIKFDTVIIDEASQITEAQIIGILSFFNKFILIGDHNQLPPVILQNNNQTIVTNQLLKENNIIDLKQSLFERLFKTCSEKGYENAYGTLTTHYRMHKQIADLINDSYENKLKENNDSIIQNEVFSIFNHESNNPIEVMLSCSRTIFIESEYEKTSKINKNEAKRIIKIIKTIKSVFNEHFDNKTIGVITPWRAQIAEIKKNVESLTDNENISIDTVERFQGSEKDIIIVSLAVFAKEQLNQLQSLNINNTIDRKLIVTLSRAKQQVIILGYTPILIENKLYSKLIENIRNNSGYINAEKANQLFEES